MIYLIVRSIIFHFYVKGLCSFGIGNRLYLRAVVIFWIAQYIKHPQSNEKVELIAY